MNLTVTLNRTDYDRFEEECIKGFSNNCFEVKFEETYRFSQVERANWNLEIFYNVVRLIEDQSTIYKLMLEIVSLFGVFFGLIVLSTVKMILH